MDLKGTIMGAKAMKDFWNVGHFCMFLLLIQLHTCRRCAQNRTHGHFI